MIMEHRVYIIQDYGETCLIAASGVKYIVPTELLRFESELFALIDEDELTEDRKL